MVLGVFCAFFTFILGVEVLFMGSMPEIKVNAKPSSQSFNLLSDAGVRQNKAQFSAIIKRPMFYQDRAPIDQVTTKTGALSDWLLTGVVVTSKQRFALLENEQRVKRKQESARLRLKEKEYLDGTDWSVLKIEKTEVTFQRGNQQEVLKLVEKRQPVKKERRSGRK